MRSAEYERVTARGALESGPVGVILIDDHAILRDGLRALLDAESDFHVIAEAGTVAEGIVMSRRLQPDAVIIDISFPEGGAIGAIGTLRRECPGTTIIVLTVHDSEEFLCAVMRAGAHGFVAKDAVFDVLLNTLRSATSNREQAAHLLPSRDPRGTLTPALTVRERQVLVGVAQGYTSKEIAATLRRSVKTIVKHRSNMMRKLSLHDSSAVTRFALENGLLTP